MEITQFTSFKLHQATALIDRVADNYLQSTHGIRFAPYLVLLMVEVLGPTDQQSIATALDVSRASITQRVGALRERNLLRVEPSPADPRANLVSLTVEGERLVHAAWQGLDRDLAEVDEGVDEAALAAQLDRLIRNSLAVLAKQQGQQPIPVSRNRGNNQEGPHQ
jgi:DNA-binding MarR family transcriptional regulator